MIPSLSNELAIKFNNEEQPSHTYKMHLSKSRVRGFADGVEAMKQAIYKAILTERYKFIIYSWEYGIELEDLFGQPVSYVCPEIERRIKEALLHDSRISDVTNFKFDFPKKGIVHVTFTAHTIFGEIEAEREVNF